MRVRLVDVKNVKTNNTKKIKKTPTKPSIEYTSIQKSTQKKERSRCKMFLNRIQLENRFLLKSDLWAKISGQDLMDNNSSYCLYDRKTPFHVIVISEIFMMRKNKMWCSIELHTECGALCERTVWCCVHFCLVGLALTLTIFLSTII